MGHHLAGTVALGVIFFYNICPQHTCGTELCDFHEIIGTDTEIEADFACGKVARHSRFGQLTEVFVTPCQCISQFLIDIGTCIVQSYRVDGDTLDMGVSGCDFNQFLAFTNQGTYVFALFQHFTYRVEIDGAV